MSEALSVGMLRSLVIYFLGYVKLGEYAIKEGKKNNNKKNHFVFTVSLGQVFLSWSSQSHDYSF